MARILMLGAFGQRNVGDDALCSTLCDALVGHEIVVASADPAATERLADCQAIPVRATAIVREVELADVVVVGGGTVFKSLHASSGRFAPALLANTLMLTTWARWRSTPTALVGVGADTLRGGLARRLAGRIVPRTSLLVLRDEESAAVLTAAGATPPFWIGADLAWRMFQNQRPERRHAHDGPPRVTVAISHLAGGVGDDIADRLGEALVGLHDAGWEIALQPWQSGDADLEVGRRIRAHIPRARLVPAPIDLVDAAHRFAEDDLVVAMRFHALVAAGAAGTPCVALAHEPKLAGLARRLDQIAVPPDASVAVLGSAVDWAVTHAAPSDAAVGREIVLADHTVRLLRLLVERDVEHPEQLPALALSDGGGRW